MAITFRSAKTARTGDAGGTLLALGKPTGTVAGDLLIAVLSANQNYTITPEAGWSSAILTTEGNHAQQVFWKIAGSSEPSAYGFTFSATAYLEGIIAAYTGAHPSTPIDVVGGQAFSSATSVIAPSVNTTGPGDLVLSIFGTRSGATLTTPTGTTERGYVTVGGGYPALKLTDRTQAAAGATGTTTATAGASSQAAGQHVAIKSANNPPNAPTLVAPASGATLDRNATQRFDWDFSDPDAGDSQSKYDLRYRIVGTSTWTDITGTTPNTYHDFAAGAFAPGDYEWQVRTYDAQGVDGPYSGSAFFTAATAPPQPTISDPINGETVQQEETVTWSAPDQAAYQLRRVGDNAGAADTATIYEDTGEVSSTAARSRSVTFATNDRYEHVQVRIKLNGLWSSWASIRVHVSYTPPPIPGVNLAPSGTGIVVTVFNPTPGAGEPAVTHNEVYVDDGAGETRRVAELVPNGSWTYQTPRSGRDYTGAVRVVAVGDNGTRSSS